jgi:Glutamine amidotransferase domain
VNKVIENAGVNGTRKLILHKENSFLFGYPDFFDQRFYDDQHKNSFCLLGGEFFKSDDLEKNKTPESLSPGKKVQRFAQLYNMGSGFKKLKYLDGSFVFVLYDRSQFKLTIIKDSLGLHPLYFVEISGHLVFSSEYQILTNLSFENRCLNNSALQQYLLSGVFLDGKTPILGLNNLTKASRFIWNVEGKKVVDTYEDWKYEIDRSLSFQNAVAHL